MTGTTGVKTKPGRNVLGEIQRIRDAAVWVFGLPELSESKCAEKTRTNCEAAFHAINASPSSKTSRTTHNGKESLG